MPKNIRNRINNLDEKIRMFVENKSNNNVETGNMFCKWCLLYLFEQNEDESEEATRYNGVNDNSIDALFELNDKLYILQTKYSSSHKWDGIAKLVLDIKRIAKGEVIGNRQELLEASAKIRDSIAEEKEIKVFYITNKELTSYEEKKIIEIKEELNAAYYNFSLNIFGISQINTYMEDRLNDIPKRFDGKELKLGVISYMEANDTKVAQVSLRDFARFVTEGDESLFYSNIRNYLKKTAVNKGIQSTLAKEAHYFWYYNNGVTIVCDEVKPINHKLLNLKTPQIVNGCQTANSIKFFFKKLTKDEQEKVDGKLLVKIIEDPKRNKRTNITRYTNSQNAVRGKDFYALDTFQKDLQVKFREYGYYYEIQAGARFLEKGNYAGQEKYRYLLPENFDNFIIAKDTIQTYTAGFKQMPGVAYGSPSELTPTGERWKEIIDDAPEFIEYYLFPYLVLKYAKTYLGYNNKSKDFRRSAGLLFVCTYFSTLVKILVCAERLNPFEENTMRISKNDLNKIFDDSEMNKKLLKLTDEILKYYFKDSTIKEYIGDNLGNFLKRTIDNKDRKVKNILLDKIDDSIKEMENKDLMDFFE